jgi:hypothetical protein
VTRISAVGPSVSALQQAAALWPLDLRHFPRIPLSREATAWLPKKEFSVQCLILLSQPLPWLSRPQQVRPVLPWLKAGSGKQGPACVQGGPPVTKCACGEEHLVLGTSDTRS